jgi:hypothetical protein
MADHVCPRMEVRNNIDFTKASIWLKRNNDFFVLNLKSDGGESSESIVILYCPFCGMMLKS